MKNAFCMVNMFKGECLNIFQFDLDIEQCDVIFHCALKLCRLAHVSYLNLDLFSGQIQIRTKRVLNDVAGV